MAPRKETHLKPTELAIHGMHCDGCVRRLSRALEKVPGAKGAKVTVGRVEVELADEAAKQATLDAIAAAGFSVVP
jgi:copper chaperone CopZ